MNKICLKKNIYLMYFCISFLALILNGCANRPVYMGGGIAYTIPSMKDYINTHYYTTKNIWHDDSYQIILGQNSHIKKFLPIGTKALILLINEQSIKFKVGKIVYSASCLKKYGCHSVKVYFEQYFDKTGLLNQKNYQLLSNIEKNAIQKGIINNQMSRNAVLITYGLPIPSIKKDDYWVYVLNRKTDLHVQFKNNQTTSIEKIAMVTRIEDCVGDKCQSNNTKINLGVIKFENISNSKQYDWLRTGVAELMTTNLAQIPTITIVERSQFKKILNNTILNQSGISRSNNDKNLGIKYKNIGVKIGADHLIIGSYLVNQNQLQLNARLVNTETGKVLNSERATGSVHQWNTVVDILTLRLSDNESIGYKLTQAEKEKIKQTSLYMMKMIEAFSQGKLSKARKLYVEALRKDPTNKALLEVIKDIDIQNKAIAVIEFHDNNNLPKYRYLRKKIANDLTDILIKRTGLPIVERLNLKHALNEIILDQYGIIDPLTAAKIGKLAGATTMLTGSFEVINNNITVYANIIDTERAITLLKEKETGELSDLKAIEKSLTKRLISTLMGVKDKNVLTILKEKLKRKLSKFEFNFNESLITFDSGRAQIKNRSYNFLNDLADLLKKYPKYRILIIGHTDNIGGTEYNEILSKKRARSIHRYMLNRHVSKNRLTLIGFGKTHPIANNTTEAGRAKNRRVEFQFIRLENNL